MCGGAQKVLELSTEYAKVRVAVRAADRHVPGGQAQVRGHAGGDREREVHHLLRRVGRRTRTRPTRRWRPRWPRRSCSDAYRKVAGDGIQVHGGIGFTWEHDMHLYFKRAKGSEVAFGDATLHRERVARLLEL